MTVTLTWGAATNATSYQLQVATDNGFASLFLDVTTSGLSYDVTGLGSGVTYYWRVRGVNIGGNGTWSSTWDFSSTLGIPTITSPNGITLSGTGAWFIWSAVTGATNYNIQISTDSGFTAIVYEDTTSGTTVAISGLIVSTTYYWRVSAGDSPGISAWSSTGTFTTAASVSTPDMLYNFEEIQDQLVATIKTNSFVTSNKVNVDIHVGEITPRTIFDPDAMEGLVHRTPFIFVQYQGKSGQVTRDAVAAIYIDSLVFRFFVGAPTASQAKGTQRTYAAPMLRAIFAAIHGRVPLMDPSVQPQKLPFSPTLTASAALPNGITTVGFNPQSVMLKPGGQDEKLVFVEKGIVVYSTDYQLRLQT